TARFLEVVGADGLERAVGLIGLPCVLKSAQFGYDGKGQVLIEASTVPAEAWARMGADLGILEAFVDFAREISVIVARGTDGRILVYPPVENTHRNHVLATTVAPARLAAGQAEEAEAIARRIADALDVVGLLAVEMFVTRSGDLLVNELAPRPHNSGHWTIEA